MNWKEIEKKSRINRGLTQNIYLLEKKSDLEYKVMGTSGKPYTITIGKFPKCTCPDYSIRRKRCKHIYFVLIRIMNFNDPEKKEFTDEDLVNMINNIPPIVGVISNTGQQNLKFDLIEDEKIVEPKVDDNCPICLDEVKILPYVSCKKCGHCVHIECFEMWIKFGHKKNKCIFCQNPFL